MSSIIPPQYLFRYSLPVKYAADVPATRSLLDLDESYRLPHLGELGGAKPIAQVSMAWNKGGLGVAVDVRGKTRKPERFPTASADPDGIQLWFDTRNTQSIHRASKYCLQFSMQPSGGGARGLEPLVQQEVINRARDDAPPALHKKIKAKSEIRDDGYRMEVWFPAETLYGFDTESYPRLGFYYLVVDRELGQQPLTVNREFPFEQDPSLWSTLELCSPH